MASFTSDNTTGSAWVSSGSRFPKPGRPRNLESAFLAGDYATANKHRQARSQRVEREYTRNQSQPMASSAPVPNSSTGRTVGRLSGITASSNTSLSARLSRQFANLTNNRLTTVKNTFKASSGFALDGVELTTAEYEAWMSGDPRANQLVKVESKQVSISSQPQQPLPPAPLPPAPRPAAPRPPARVSSASSKKPGSGVDASTIILILFALGIAISWFVV